MATLNFEDEEHFYINGNRFFVLFKHSIGADYSLLEKNFFEIRKTEVGAEVRVNKKSGYVGLAVPIENNLLVGNEIFPVNDFNGHHYLYNKKNFNGSYTFQREDTTSISCPIIHSIVDENTCFSISPTTKEEVIITPHTRSFQPYVRLETYAAHGSGFVSFFIDSSSNYHLNLRRVSKRIRETKTINNLSTVFDYQELFFNNCNITKSSSKKKTAVKEATAIYNFIDKSLEVSPFFTGDAALYFDDLLTSFPNTSEIVIGTENDGEYTKSKARIIDKVNGLNDYDFEEYSGRKREMVIKGKTKATVRILFSMNKKNLEKHVKEDTIRFLNLDSTLNLKLLEFQSWKNESISEKKEKLQRQKISKIAHLTKEEKKIENYNVFGLVSGYTNKKFTDYFQEYDDQFNHKELKRIKTKYLKGATKAYLDVSVNRPFFVSCFETGEYFLLPIVNSQSKAKDVRLIVGQKFDNIEWFSLSKQLNENVRVDSFMKHSEVFINNVKFGGLLKITR